jgi:hypothetical protein
MKRRKCFSHFQNILGTSEPRGSSINWSELQLPQVPSNHQLGRPFTKEEIKATISELPVEKAPIPDGFTGVFIGHVGT